ncbi:unnamed protein product, partial [Ixodes persulcatus]
MLSRQRSYLGREQKVLCRVLEGRVHDHLKDPALVLRPTYLVDLVDAAKGHARQLLQRHHVDHRGHAALPSTLVGGRQLRESLVVPELDPDVHPILVVLVGFLPTVQAHL